MKTRIIFILISVSAAFWISMSHDTEEALAQVFLWGEVVSRDMQDHTVQFRDFRRQEMLEINVKDRTLLETLEPGRRYRVWVKEEKGNRLQAYRVRPPWGECDPTGIRRRLWRSFHYDDGDGSEPHSGFSGPGNCPVRGMRDGHGPHGMGYGHGSGGGGGRGR